MIAIFSSQKAADDFSKEIHDWLTKNRGRYNAERWTYTNKADKTNQWAVKIPSDFESLNEKLAPENRLLKAIGIVDEIAKYPVNWNPIEIEIKPIDEKIIIKR